MIYYSLKLQALDISGRPLPCADGETLSTEAKSFLGIRGKIKNLNLVEKAPVFDFFTLREVGSEEYSDWILNDVHEFIGTNSPIIRGFLISEKLHQVLNKFSIQLPFKYYPSKLIYQNVKYSYYIFQISSEFIDNLIFKKTNFQYSKFANKDNAKPYIGKFDSKSSYNYGLNHLPDKSLRIFPSIAVFEKYYDLMWILGVDLFAISSRLKMAIESQGITGIEITPIEHVDFLFEEEVPDQYC